MQVGARFGLACRRLSRGLLLLVSIGLNSGCRCETDPKPHDSVATESSARVAAPTTPPAQLFVPDANVEALYRPGQPRVVQPPGSGSMGQGSTGCPENMLLVAGAFCIDQYESSLVELSTGRPVSPYYHPTRNKTQAAYGFWQKERGRVGSTRARRMILPEPPAWQLAADFDIMATSKPGVVPSGYLSGDIAQRACLNAGKRLCSEQEWVTACRGEEGRKYPYGDAYEHGACNVFGAVHPALVLHGDASEGHTDPRLNLVDEGGRPLLMPSGSLPECASRWQGLAIYDMVGNLDEWVADEGGKFLGGFYARSTREGCDASVSAHLKSYYDYSLGTRCCTTP